MKISHKNEMEKAKITKARKGQIKADSKEK